MTAQDIVEILIPIYLGLILVLGLFTFALWRNRPTPTSRHSFWMFASTFVCLLIQGAAGQDNPRWIALSTFGVVFPSWSMSALLATRTGRLLPLQAWAGIAVIGCGIQLSSWNALRSGVGRAALGFAAGTGFCISIYSVVDGVGVRLSGHTLSYWAWGAFLHLFIAGFVAVRRWRTLAHLPAKTWVLGLAGGLVSMIAYGLVLYAKNFAPLGAVSALRETSVIFAALIGFVFLKEGYWMRRLGSAVLMAAGVGLIGTAV